MCDNFSMMGIYKIINRTNGKFYIGSSININKRWNKHIGDLNANRHHNLHLQRAWNKYGGDNFEFRLVEAVEDFNMLEDTEQRWMDNTKCYLPNIGYNLSADATRPSVGSNKSTVSIVRTDTQKLILNKQINKNEGHMLFVLGSFLSKYDNSVKLKGKYPSIEEIKEITGFGNNVCYKTLKTLEEKNLIKRKNINKNNIIYLNPYYIRYRNAVDKNIYKLFN